MNSRDVNMLLTLGVFLILVVWVNDFLSALVREKTYGITGYVIHLAALVAVTAYAVTLKRQLASATRQMAACRAAWRLLPGAMAIVKGNETAEIFGDINLVRQYGLTLGTLPGEQPCVKAERTEECWESAAGERVVERRIYPLAGFNAGGYAAEFIFDISERTMRAREREDEYLQMLKNFVNMFEMKDPYSHGHSENVSSLSQELAKHLGLPQVMVDRVTRAALLHDIGKILVPSDILGKAGALSPGEFAKIRDHAAAGADILSGLAIFREEADIVRHHHERFDGRGYPGRLAGEAIPCGARIIAVADAFDAMTTGRSFLGRRDVTAALAIMAAERGKQFDPEMVDAFTLLVNSGRRGADYENLHIPQGE